MDFSEKQAARSKWRSTQHLKRVHGGRGRSRAGQPGAPHCHEPAPDLDSNYDRYQLSEEGEADEGQPQRTSAGADLAQLLQEGEQFYAQAHYRYRSFIDTSSSEPPPVDVAALEKELAIEVGPLMQALALLPLPELLGIDPDLLVDCSPLTPDSSNHQQQQQQQQQQQSLHGAPQHHQQPHQAQQPSHPASNSRLPALFRNAGPSAAAAAAAPVARQAAAPLPAAPPAPQAAAAADDDNDDEEELLKLLTAGSSSNNSSTAAQPTLQRPAAAPPPAAAAARAPSVPVAGNRGVAAGADVDPLDLLLGATGSSKANQAPPAAAGGKGSSSSKKKSLEDWLDGY